MHRESCTVAVGHTVSGNQIRAGLLGDSKLVLLYGGDSLKAHCFSTAA